MRAWHIHSAGVICMHRDWAVSQITPCENVRDRIAETWFYAMVESNRIVGERIVSFDWLYDRYEWGPVRWPFRWRDLIDAKTLDCGVFADLVQHALVHVGVKCTRIQWIELASRTQTMHWEKLWKDVGINSSNWIIDDSHVYHELIAFESVEGPKFYDSTEGRIVLPVPPTPRVEWIKQCEQLDAKLSWDGVELVPGEWCYIDSIPYERRIVEELRRDRVAEG